MAMKFKAKSRHYKNKIWDSSAFWWIIAVGLIIIIALFISLSESESTEKVSIEENDTNQTKNIKEVAEQKVVEKAEQVKKIEQEVELIEEIKLPKTQEGLIDVNMTGLDNDNCRKVLDYVYFHYITLFEQKKVYDEQLSKLPNKRDQIQGLIDGMEDEEAPSLALDFAKEEQDRLDSEIKYYQQMFDWSVKEMKEAKYTHDQLEKKCFILEQS